MNFLTDHNITSMEAFAERVVQIHEQLRDLSNNIQKTERRLGKLAEHLVHADNHKKYKSVYQKYKNLAPKPQQPSILNPFPKKPDTTKQDAYYDKHAEEIQLYLDAKRYFDVVMNGRDKLPIKDWQAEQTELRAKKYTLSKEYYTLKDEIKSVEVLRRSVENIMGENLQKGHLIKTRSTSL